MKKRRKKKKGVEGCDVVSVPFLRGRGKNTLQICKKGKGGRMTNYLTDGSVYPRRGTASDVASWKTYILNLHARDY